MIGAAADVLVIGAGVIGLTTAVHLAEAGVAVTVAAAEPPRQTTSVAAGAIWGPHLVGMDDRIERWARVTREHWASSGLARELTGVAASRDEGATLPEFATAASGLTECEPSEVPYGYRSGWRLTAPVLAMPGYLDYLHERFGRAGGTTTFPDKFSSLDDASRRNPRARVIVNASGCGARDLVPDSDVTPVRGQAVVTSNPGITEFFVGAGADPADLTYLFPHADTVVLGGTQDVGNWSREPDPATAERILAACTAVQPALRRARILGHRVGLRPARPLVRLEAEQAAGVTVVHNYGHGGAGVTLSWGCAQDAAALALAALR